MQKLAPDRMLSSYVEQRNEPFLASRNDGDQSLENLGEGRVVQKQNWRVRWLTPFLLLSHIPTIILLYLLWWRSLTKSHKQQCAHPQLLPSPVQFANALKYELRRWPVSFLASPYAGEPSPALDLAWHNLFEDVNIRVSGEDLAAVNLTSVALIDGGYVAQLGVYHELHCIKKVRQWIYREYYVPNIPKTERDEWAAHINHCLEMLRVSAMCRGDTSLSTFSWIRKGDRRYPTAMDTGPHQCVNWESLAEWVHQRSVNISDPNTLTHPENANNRN